MLVRFMRGLTKLLGQIREVSMSDVEEPYKAN